MKVNLAVPATNLEGQPFVDAKGEPTTISKQLGNAIFQTPDKEAPLASYELAKKVYHSEGEIDLTASEVEKIKAILKENFIAGFSGQVLELLSKSEK